MLVILIKVMKKKILILGACLFVLAASSCKKESCEGFDTIVELDNLYLFADDTLQYFENIPNQFFGISFSIFDDTKSKNGGRNCSTNDLAIKFEDSWDKDEISLKCDRDIKSGSQTFRANTELIGASITRLTFEKEVTGEIKEGKISLVGVDGITQSADYEFILRMETEGNKRFTANTTIHIKK